MSSEKWRSPKQPPVREEANSLWLTIRQAGEEGATGTCLGWYDTESGRWHGHHTNADGYLATCGIVGLDGHVPMFDVPRALRKGVVRAWMPFRAPAAFDGKFDE